jgi:hypothetical protein
MSLISENIIPGNHGRIYGTNASTNDQMEGIKHQLEKIEGVKNVTLINGVFPKEFIVHTSKLISVKIIEDAVKKMLLHAIAKGLCEL